MFRRARLVGSLAVAIGVTTGIAFAQTTPTRPAGPSAALPLRLAYRAIGAAESRGAGGRYLDAARTHYRGALARLGRNDNAGAAREAGASAALARAAVDERPIPVPRDLPTPPAMPSALPRMEMMGRMGPGGPPRPGGPAGPGGFFRRPRFDPESLARFATLENTSEATDLAKTAMDADAARSRALFAGNRDDAMRQGRLAMDLSLAVRMLASADHPEAFPRPMRRPMDGPGFRPPGAPGAAHATGTIGFAPPDEIDEMQLDEEGPEPGL